MTLTQARRVSTYHHHHEGLLTSTVVDARHGIYQSPSGEGDDDAVSEPPILTNAYLTHAPGAGRAFGDGSLPPHRPLQGLILPFMIK
jgi:hypothetical protein